MANKDLINLGISPDSGTGDSARRGGEKINTLFADIYTQLGDNPVGQDPNEPFYAYRRPFYEYEYKVGELHPAGRFIPIQFTTTNSIQRLYDQRWGWGYDQNGNLIDSDGDGVPDIYRDSEWYFLSRGEKIDADFTKVSKDGQVHFVLPIGVPGDSIIVRDGFGTWDYADRSDSEQDSDNHVRQGSGNKNIHVSFWTTPWEFQSLNQIREWETATGRPGSALDSDGLSVRDPISGNFFRSNWHKVKNISAIEQIYPKLDQPFATSRSTDPYDGLSPTYSVNTRRYQFEFLFTSYEEGWVIRQIALDAADVQAAILNLTERVDKIDSDLERGLYVSADSDVRHTVPIFRRTTDGREVHGNLSLRGDPEAIMTTIDSEDTPLINDPRSGLGGDTVQPLTTTIRFKLRDNVKIKDDLVVGKNLTAGGTFKVTEAFTIDSDAVVVNDTFKILDSEGLQRLVFEKVRQGQFYDAVKGSGADLSNPNERPTVEADYALHVKSNAVFGRDSDDVVVFNSRIMSNLVPFGDELYNLGDSDNKWKDLYLAGNTIHLGAVKIKEQFGRIFVTDSDDNRIDLIGADFTTDNLNVDSDVLIGGNSALFGRLSVGEHASFDSDVYIAGNLEVKGTTTFINTQNLEINDNTIVLNKNQPTPSESTGIIFTRYDSDNVSITNYNGLLIWEESTKSYVLGQTPSSGITRQPIVSNKYLSIGDGGAAEAPIVFDYTGNSDPEGLGRVTITGDGTAVLDGGVF